MRLNEEQLSVIKEVRARMNGNGYVPRYICAAIRLVLQDHVAEGFRSEESAKTMKNHLSSAITGAIGGMVTFGGFMIVTCPILSNMSENDGDAYEYTIHLARLTWLDRILETGEIVAEKFEGIEEKCIYAKAE